MQSFFAFSRLASLLYTPNCEIKPGMVLPEGVKRYALVVEYNGARFQGFQKQASTPNTVQAALEQALSKIAAQPVTLVCAGRTDAGVHATRQVVHFDTTVERPHRAWREGSNTHLPDTVRVQDCYPVPTAFHARFSALARTYRYLTYCSEVRPALLSDLVTWYRQPLDIEAMSSAGQYLLGEHDFSSFRASQCQARNPMRNVERLMLERRGPLIIMEIKANAFLHHMVRNIIGALFEVGRGAKPIEWMAHLLSVCDRRQNAATAPAYGLHFVGVDYPPEFGLSSQPFGPNFLEVSVN